MKHTAIKPTKQNGYLVEIDLPIFKQKYFDTEDMHPLHIPIEYDGETYSSGILLFNGDFCEIVPVKAIYNPDIEGGLLVISLLINNNID